MVRYTNPKIDSSDIEKQYDSDYNEAINNWSDSYNQMDTDALFYVGDQWSNDDKEFLFQEGRSVYVYNYVQRNINMIVGNQRKNRLGFGVDPVEKEDVDIADFLNSLLIWQANQSNAYHIISDAFEETAITGLSLIGLSLDYSRDIVNGELKCNAYPFQSILIDPNFSKMDLSDCRFIMQRTIVSKEEAKSFLPQKADEIDELPSGVSDDKFTFMASGNLNFSDDVVAYDEYYRRSSRKKKIIVNRENGQIQEWLGSSKELNLLQEIGTQFEIIDKIEPYIEYHVFIQGKLMYSGEDPLGIGEFPFVPVLWIYKPHVTDYSYKIQGMIRSIRDPQIEYNRRRSQMVDVIASQINSGWIVSEGAVKNVDDLFKTGQGQVIEVNQGHQLGELQKITPSEISQSLVAITQQLSTDMLQISGLNDDAIGINDAGNTEISGRLAQQRLSNSLTILKSPIDKLELSQKLLGQKILKVMIANYSQSKLERIAGRPLPQSIQLPDLLKYDVVVKEAMLTDTQRTLAFAQGMQALQAGLPIPMSFLMNIYPTSDKQELMEAFQQEQEQNQKQQALLQEQAEIQAKLQNAEIVHKLSLAEQQRETAVSRQALAYERLAKSDAELAQMNLNNIKSALEIQGIDRNQLIKTLQFLLSLEQQTKMQDVALTKATSAEAEKDVVASNQLNTFGNPQEQLQSALQNIQGR